MDILNYKKKFNISNKPGYESFNLMVENLFEKYYPKLNSLSKEQHVYLEDIILTVKEIKNILTPLTESGFKYDLSLVGGAVRDFVLDNSSIIKDYDFSIAIRGEIIDNLTIHKILSEDEIRLVNKKLSEIKAKRLNADNEPFAYSDYEEKCDKNMEFDKFCKSRLLENTIKEVRPSAIFFKNKEMAEKYLNKHINLISQFTNHSGKKVDLILSVDEFIPLVKTFDFEICKGEIDFTSAIKNDFSLEDMKKEAFDNMYLQIGMLRDLDEKTLTIAADHFEKEDIDYFMNKHFLKLKQKFSDYDFNYILRNKQKEEDKKEVLILLHKYKLSCNLPIKEDFKSNKKCKI